MVRLELLPSRDVVEVPEDTLGRYSERAEYRAEALATFGEGDRVLVDGYGWALVLGKASSSSAWPNPFLRESAERRRAA